MGLPFGCGDFEWFLHLKQKKSTTSSSVTFGFVFGRAFIQTIHRIYMQCVDAENIMLVRVHLTFRIEISTVYTFTHVEAGGTTYLMRLFWSAPRAFSQKPLLTLTTKYKKDSCDGSSGCQKSK
jgi:hypothetical protein